MAARDRLAFVLVTPDAVARHLAGPILRRLGDHGFRPVAHRLTRVGAEELDAIYRIDDFAWETFQFRLLDRLLRFGPALAVLVRDEVPGDEPVHERLRRLKGSTHPGRARPGTLRHDFAGINAILNLVHTADSPEDSRRESEILMGSPPPRPSASGEEGERGVLELCALLELGRPAETRSFDDVLAGFRARLLTAAWDDMAPAARAQAAGLAAAGLARPGVGPALRGALPNRHPLAGLLGAEFSASDADRLDDLPLRLAGHGVELDPWEVLVLETSSRFEPVRGAGGLTPGPRADAEAG